MKIILTLLLLSVSLSSYADVDVTWSWTEVTEDVFDNPITIVEYRLYCNTSEVKNFPASQLSHTSTLPEGTYTCRSTAVSDLGIESEMSNVVVKIVDGEPPEVLQPKPTVLSVN